MTDKPRLNFLQHENLLRAEVEKTGNKQSQLATATLLRYKLKENVARITWPLLWGTHSNSSISYLGVPNFTQ